MTSSGAVFLRHAGFIDGSTTEASWLYVSDTGLDQLIRLKLYVILNLIMFDWKWCCQIIIHCIVRVPVLTMDGTFDVVGGDKVVKQVFIICVVVEGK